MIYKIRKIWHPEIFQGRGKKSPYFEGWYYKLVDSSGKNTYAMIPGAFIAENEQKSHAFIQILDGQKGKFTYHEFALNQFWASRKELEIRIGSNIFKRDYLELNIQSDERNIKGRIRMSNLNPWPVTLTSPGIMGWYAFVPRMECYHGVVSLDHTLSGSLTIVEKTIDFDGGRGYTEKDWGKSFPSSYIWMQSNHFDEPGISLTASIANIPWLNSSFRGFIIGLHYQGKLYRFTTYTKAALKVVQLTDTQISFIVSNRTHILKIKAERSSGGVLHAPLDKEMHKRVSHSLNGKIYVELCRTNSSRAKPVYRGTGNHAGIEINGNLDGMVDR